MATDALKPRQSQEVLPEENACTARSFTGILRAMSESSDIPEPGAPTAARGPRSVHIRKASNVHIYNVGAQSGYVHGPVSTTQSVGAMRIEIHGSWSVGDLIRLLGRL